MCGKKCVRESVFNHLPMCLVLVKKMNFSFSVPTLIIEEVSLYKMLYPYSINNPTII